MSTELVWVIINDYGDGVPCAGPFDSILDACAYAPYEERFEPRQVSRRTAEQHLAHMRPYVHPAPDIAPFTHTPFADLVREG